MGHCLANKRCMRQRKRGTYTIFPKFSNGVPHVACGDRRGALSTSGRPRPRPAPLVPPPGGRCKPKSPSTSRKLSFGGSPLARRAARPPNGGRPGADGEDTAERSAGCVGLSESVTFRIAFVAASTEFTGGWLLRAAILGADLESVGAGEAARTSWDRVPLPSLP